MADWELTATTIYCEDAADEVTLLISAEGTFNCTGHQKHGRADEKAGKKNRQSGRESPCGPGECSRIVQYRKKWLGD